jgi:hypothetical protein
VEKVAFYGLYAAPNAQATILSNARYQTIVNFLIDAEQDALDDVDDSEVTAQQKEKFKNLKRR